MLTLRYGGLFPWGGFPCFYNRVIIIFFNLIGKEVI